MLVFVGLSFGVVYIFSRFELGDSRPSEGEFLLTFLLGRVTPILGGFLCASLIYRRLVKRYLHAHAGAARSKTGKLTLRKAVIWTLIGFYLLTWSMGVPSVQSSINKNSINEYKRMKEEYPDDVGDASPYMKSYIAFPILPGIIMTYHEYQLAYLCGYGGWDIYLWYLFGSKCLWRCPSWLS